MEAYWLARREGPAQRDFERIPIGRPVAGWNVAVDRFRELDSATNYFVIAMDPSRPDRGINFVLQDLKPGVVRSETDTSIEDFKTQNLLCST